MARLHRFRAHQTVLATGGYGRAYFSCTSAHTCTGDGGGMVLRAGLPLQDMEFVQFHPTGIYGAGCLITEGVRGEGGILRNSAGERFMERYAPNAKDLASRDVVSRAMTIEIREGRGVGPTRITSILHLEHLGSDTIHEKLPGIAETAKIFAGVDVSKQPIPVLPTVHYNMGGIPANYHGEVVTLKDGQARQRRAWSDGGRRGCVRVGARRESTRLELVARSRRIRSRSGTSLRGHRQAKHQASSRCRAGAGDFAVSRIDKLRNAKGSCKTADIRLNMQRVMQGACGSVPHRRVAAGRRAKLAKVLRFVRGRQRQRPQHGLEYRSDRDARARQFAWVRQWRPCTRRSIAQESRGAHAREDFPNRDDVNWMKHTLSWVSEQGKVNLDYRPVHLNTLTNDVEPIPPKARVY